MQAAASSSDGDDTPIAMLPPTAKRAATAGAAQLSPSLHPGQPQTTPTAASTANPPQTTSKTMPGVMVTIDRSTSTPIQPKAGQYYGQGVDTDMQASCTPAAVDEASAEEQQAVLQVAPVLPMAQPTSSPIIQSGNVPDPVLVRPAVDSHSGNAPGGLISDSESGSQGGSPDAMQADDPQLRSPDAGHSAGAPLQQAPVATATFPVAMQIDDAQLHRPGNVYCPAAAIQLAAHAAATSPHAMQSESLQLSHPSNDHSSAAALQLAPKPAAAVSQVSAIAIPSNTSLQDQTSDIHLQADTAARSQSQNFAAANVSEPAADISMQPHEASQVLHPVAAAAPVNAPVSPASMAEPHAAMLSGAHASVPHAVPLQDASAATAEQAHGQLSVPPTVTGPNGLAASGMQVHMPQPGPAHGAQQAEATLPTSGMTACPAPSSVTAKHGKSNSVYDMMFPPQFALQLQQQRAGTDRPVDSTASLVQAEAEAARLRAVLADSSRLSNDHDDATAALLTTKPELAAGDMLPQHASPHAKLTSRDQVQGTSAVDLQADESQQHAVSISDAIIPDR